MNCCPCVTKAGVFLSWRFAFFLLLITGVYDFYYMPRWGFLRDSEFRLLCLEVVFFHEPSDTGG